MRPFQQRLLDFRPRRVVEPAGATGDKQWIRISKNPDIVFAQYASLKRQVPLLYLLLIVTALAVFYISLGSAPLAVSVSATLLIVSASGWRFVSWVWFFPPPDTMSVGEARTILRRTTLAVIPICTSYLGYAFLLDQFGDPYVRAGLAVGVVLTAIGCIFCLIHLPHAAMLVHVLTMVPYTLYHLYQGNSTFFLVAVNAAIVTTLMIRVSRNAFEEFTELITSRAELAAQRCEAERLAAENASLAMTDALTGLPNRRLFLARLESQVQMSERTGEEFVVGVLDLDRFKPVNDVYGHATGDQLLIEVGRRLQSLASDRVLVARLGGDEFGLLLNGNIDFARDIGTRVSEIILAGYEIDGHGFSLGCSIGFASFPEAGHTASAIFDRADYALYDVKSDYRGGYTFFTEDLEVRLRAETELEATLLSANLERELTAELQPIVCLATGKVIGIEALGRWESELIGKVEPARFIEAAERLNMMDSITRTLFDKSLASIASLPGHHRLSFNLSTHDIVTSATVDLLIATITKSGLSPERVTFEITETALMRDYDTAIEHIERLRSLGVSIALDDFGTGFSSLNYLNRLPIDIIKVDRSFVQNLAEPGVGKIVAAILGLCENLELECVFEGVETPEQCRDLLRLGCKTAQGYLFARPMNIAALSRWLEEGAQQAFSSSVLPGLKNQPAWANLNDLYGFEANCR